MSNPSSDSSDTPDGLDLRIIEEAEDIDAVRMSGEETDQLLLQLMAMTGHERAMKVAELSSAASVNPLKKQFSGISKKRLIARAIKRKQVEAKVAAAKAKMAAEEAKTGDVKPVGSALVDTTAQLVAMEQTLAEFDRKEEDDEFTQAALQKREKNRKRNAKKRAQRRAKANEGAATEDEATEDDDDEVAVGELVDDEFDDGADEVIESAPSTV